MRLCHQLGEAMLIPITFIQDKIINGVLDLLKYIVFLLFAYSKYHSINSLFFQNNFSSSLKNLILRFFIKGVYEIKKRIYKIIA